MRSGFIPKPLITIGLKALVLAGAVALGSSYVLMQHRRGMEDSSDEVPPGISSSESGEVTLILGTKSGTLPVFRGPVNRTNGASSDPFQGLDSTSPQVMLPGTKSFVINPPKPIDPKLKSNGNGD